jgi:hypothetical protein
MKKVAFLFSIVGSGLAAFGVSGWHDWTYSAGWTLNNQLEITFGVALLVCGLMLRRDPS